jgi:hypothetical protein
LIDVVGAEAELESANGTLGYQAPGPFATGDTTATRCREKIRGRTCYIIIWQLPDGRYWTEAAWPIGDRELLTMGGLSSNSDGQQEVLAAIYTAKPTGENASWFRK